MLIRRYLQRLTAAGRSLLRNKNQNTVFDQPEAICLRFFYVVISGDIIRILWLHLVKENAYG